MNIESTLRGYVACALWSSTDDNGDPLDDGRDYDDIPPETLAKMRADVTSFVTTNRADINRSALDDEQIGHDFWLTRNGHGTGFWDRGIGAVGNRLSTACKAFSNACLYLGDDEQIYQQ
jgi:hypothetical protein